MRELTPDGFGLKVTEWNRTELLREWREHWADLVNEHLLRAGLDDESTIKVTGSRASSWSRPVTWDGRSMRCERGVSNQSASANWMKSASAMP